MMFIHQIILKLLSKITRPWNIGNADIFTLRSKYGSHCLIIWKYDTHAWNSVGDIRQNYRTMKYRSYRPKFILRSNVISNSLQDITQNLWTMKYRSQWPIFILRSNVGSYSFIISNKDVHTSNNLRDIRPNHWTIEYRPQQPTFILRSNVGSYKYILPKYDVHTSNSLQDIRLNHWNVKYMSCWPSLHDPQIHVTRLSHVSPTIRIRKK